MIVSLVTVIVSAEDVSPAPPLVNVPLGVGVGVKDGPIEPLEDMIGVGVAVAFWVDGDWDDGI